jgi:hypothetical protein
MPLTRSVALRTQIEGFETVPRRFCSDGHGAAQSRFTGDETETVRGGKCGKKRPSSRRLLEKWIDNDEWSGDMMRLMSRTGGLQEVCCQGT